MSQWRPPFAQRGVRAKSVGELAPALMRPAFEKFGFPAAAILTDWAAIAGAEIASYTAPERLKWPRNKPDDDANARAQTGGTLILRVGGARALEVEYMREQLIERINACFGYRAVSEIRIVQAPVGTARGSRSLAPAATAPADVPGLEGIEDERLRAAFARMAAGMTGEAGKSR